MTVRSLADAIASASAHRATAALSPDSGPRRPSEVWRQRRIELALDTVPDGLRWADFASPDLPARANVAAVALAKRAQRGPMVTLHGPSGAGKTITAVAMLRARLGGMRKPSGLFVSAYEIVRAQRATRFGESSELAIRSCAVGALVIDDLGQEQSGEWGKVMAELVHNRHAERRWTVVTTFLDLEGVASRYGDGTARRMFEGPSVDFGAAR